MDRVGAWGASHRPAPAAGRDGDLLPGDRWLRAHRILAALVRANRAALARDEREPGAYPDQPGRKTLAFRRCLSQISPAGPRLPAHASGRRMTRGPKGRRPL